MVSAHGGSTPTHGPELSIIVATVDAARNIERCLTSIHNATEHLDAETWVVDASRDATATLAARHVPVDHVVRFPAGTTTLALWARGIALARGRVVALTTGHFHFEASWGRSLVHAIGGDVAGVAGTIVLDREASVVDEAVFYLRYASFLDARHAPGSTIRMIPADNAAYDAGSLARHRASFLTGFSEVDFHRRLFAEGKRLNVVAGATAIFGRSYPFSVILHHRFAHGREFAAWRVTEQGGATSRIRLIVAAPFVPFVLAARAARNALRRPEHRFRFLRSMPLLLVLASAWALGEATGAIFGRGTHPDPAPSV